MVETQREAAQSVMREEEKGFPSARSLFRGSGYFALTLMVGLTMFAFIVVRISDIDFIGFSEDAAGYAEIAENIAAGRGPEQDFIDFYFVHSPSAITHVTRHWFSLYAVLLVPLITMFGKAAFVVKFMSMLCYFLSGLVLYRLFARWSSPAAACLASVLFYLHPTAIYVATQGLPDLLFLLLFSLTLVAATGTNLRASVLLALSLGLLIMVKPTGLLLLPLLVTASLLFRQTIRTTVAVIGVIGAMVLLVPVALWQSTLQAGEGVSSDHIVLMNRIGYTDNILDAHYGVVWDEPSPSIAGFCRSFLSRGRERFLTMIIAFSGQNYHAESGLGAARLFLFPLTLLAVPGLLWLSATGVRFLCIGIIIVWMLFFTAFFTPIDRYFLPALVVVLLLISHAIVALIAWFGRHGVPAWIALLILLIPLGGIAGRDTLPTLRNFFQSQPYNPYNEMLFSEQRALDEVFDYCREELPEDAVIMTLLPATVHFCTDRKTVPIPYEDYQLLVEVVNHYRVGYFLDLFPKRIYAGDHSLAGFELEKRFMTPDGVPVILYRIDGDGFCPHSVTEEACIPLWARKRGFLFCMP